MQWRKDGKVLIPNGKYRMRREGRFVELVIQDLDLTDAGSYTCVCGEQESTAALRVNGNPPSHVSLYTPNAAVLAAFPAQPGCGSMWFLRDFVFLALQCQRVTLLENILLCFFLP